MKRQNSNNISFRFFFLSRKIYYMKVSKGFRSYVEIFSRFICNTPTLLSVQFSRSVVSNSLRPHESQHARLPCSLPSPGVHSKTHVHRVRDAIQPSHPLSSLSPTAPNPSQHQSLFYLQPITFFLSSHLNGPRMLPNMCVNLFAKIDPTTEGCGCMSTLMGCGPIPF